MVDVSNNSVLVILLVVTGTVTAAVSVIVVPVGLVVVDVSEVVVSFCVVLIVVVLVGLIRPLASVEGDGYVIDISSASS